MPDASNLAQNLRLLCARARSVTAVCHALSINRQQFARYLSGESRPSLFNQKKIAEYFDIPMSDLLLRHDEFAKLHEKSVDNPSSTQTFSLGGISAVPAGDRSRIKALTGYYFSYLQTPAYPTGLLKSLVHIYGYGDRYVSTMEESFFRSSDGSHQTSRYDGVVSFLNDFLFIVDIETTTKDAILETVLHVPQRRKSDVLVGMTLGLTTGSRRVPFSSVIAFKFLGKRIDRNSKLTECGFVDIGSNSVPSTVRSIFTAAKSSHMYPLVFDRY